MSPYIKEHPSTRAYQLITIEQSHHDIVSLFLSMFTSLQLHIPTWTNGLCPVEQTMYQVSYQISTTYSSITNMNNWSMSTWSDNVPSFIQNIHGRKLNKVIGIVFRFFFQFSFNINSKRWTSNHLVSFVLIKTVGLSVASPALWQKLIN